MRQTLFFIPHELAGVPVFGIGWVLGMWLLVAGGVMAWMCLRERSWAPLAAFAPFLVAVSVAIVFIFPMIEAKDARGATLGLPIRGYGTFVLTGFVLGVVWAAYRARRWGITSETIWSLAIWLFVAGFAGARLFFVIEYWDEFRRPTWQATVMEVVKFTEGGLVVYGALIAVLPTMFFFARRHAVSPLVLGDIVAPTLVLGLAFGRLGCFMNGCCYGGVCESGPFCVAFPRLNSVAQGSVSPPYQHQLANGQLHGFRWKVDERGAEPVIGTVTPDSPAAAAGLRPGTHIAAVNEQPVRNLEQAMRGMSLAGPAVRLQTAAGETLEWTVGELPARTLPVHPTQLYSAVSALLLVLLLVASEPYLPRPGSLIALLLTCYPPVRILEEAIRVDEPGQFGTGLSISQLISVGMLVVAACLWAYLFWRTPPMLSTPRQAQQGLSAA